MDQPWDEKTVFLKALALSPEGREAYLRDACPDDSQRRRIETLLSHHAAAADEFLSPALRPAPPQDPLTERIDEFQLLHVLGEGGMGVVYLAEDTILGRRVALKVLARHVPNSQRVLDRFREEARSAAALKHPGIVPVFRFGQSAGAHYLVSEYVEGPTLAAIIDNQRRLTQGRTPTQDLRDWIQRSAGIVAAVADALECAHRAEIVHRDVKPSNILLERDGRPRLTDFGIAKHLSEEPRTQPTDIIGSCHYMSPEQASIAGHVVDQRSDVFSLGIVLYELLTLSRPFDGRDVPQVLRAVLEHEPPSLRSTDRRFPVDLEVICQKALEKEPGRRYQSAAHIAADLRSFLRGDPILAQPPSLVRRCARALRRHRTAVLVGGMVALLALTTGLTWYQSRRNAFNRCTLNVSAEPAALVTIREFDPDTLHVGPALRLGQSPQLRQLERGQYRLCAIWPDGTFTESSLLALGGGGTLSLELRRPAASDPPDDMVLIPRGEALCGDPEAGGIQAPRTVTVEAFHLDLTEVSNEQYRRFADETQRPYPLHWQEFGYQEDLADRPVVGVTWEDANAFARWRGKRLPTATEWEYAMRSPDGRRTPWVGDTPALPHVTLEDAERMATAKLDLAYREYRRHTLPVDGNPELASHAGLLHGATNVSELTESILVGEATQILIKGAAWVNSPAYFDLAHTRSLPVTVAQPPSDDVPSWSMKVGFRCARSAAP